MDTENEVTQYIIKKKLLETLPVLMTKMTMITKKDSIDVKLAKSRFYETDSMVTYAPYKRIF